MKMFINKINLNIPLEDEHLFAKLEHWTRLKIAKGFAKNKISGREVRKHLNF